MPKTRFQPGDEVLVRAKVVRAKYNADEVMVRYVVVIEDYTTVGCTVYGVSSDDVHPMIDSIATQSDDDAPLIQN